jgi:regulator of protease activity HflC (stomatin/prohibitin superfamily)
MKAFIRKIKDRAPYFVVAFLLALLAVIALWSRILVVIKPGEAGVLYRMLTTGTVTDHIYAEGLHILMPLNSMALYDTRVQLVLHDFDVLTSSGLPVKLKIAVRFQPIYELLGVLHQQVGPDYVNKIILPQIESVLRRNLGQRTPEDIYTNKDGVLSKIITLALEEVGRKYILVDEIIIRSVVLPDTVTKSIEMKLVNQQQALAYKYKLEVEGFEAERKIKEAKGIQEYQRIIASTMTDKTLQSQNIQATLELAKSPNTKVVVLGTSKGGTPIILGDK